MFETVRMKFTGGLRNLTRSRAVRRFARQQDGAAAVEFAMIAAPFLALIFAILETAMVFFAGQTLEAATADSARLILTGQAQTAGFSKTDFKTQVCNRISSLFDCNNVYVDVKNYSNFSSVSTASPVVSGVLNTSSMAYTPGGPGCIVVVSLYYQWPIYVPSFGISLSNLNGGYRLLQATSVFRNEPYGGSNACS
jgi:Flp pilus assembly protein TadG